MTLSVELPDGIARTLRLDGPESEARALEMLALEGYRSQKLSRGQVGELLLLSVQETEDFLRDRGCLLGASSEQVDQDAACLRAALGR